VRILKLSSRLFRPPHYETASQPYHTILHYFVYRLIPTHVCSEHDMQQNYIMPKVHLRLADMCMHDRRDVPRLATCTVQTQYYWGLVSANSKPLSRFRALESGVAHLFHTIVI